jgi:hypothetical protein
MHLSPKRCFVEPVFEDFLPKRERGGKSILVFDLGRGVPPTKPLGLEVGIHMCGGHLLEFFDCHIWNEEGGEMTVNLAHTWVISKKEISSTTLQWRQYNDDNTMKIQWKYKERINTSLKKSSPLSLWATEMNFSKFRKRMLLINFSWAFVITFQISVEDRRASGVASRYNLAAISDALDISLWNEPQEW